MSEYDLWNPLSWDFLPNYRLIRARRSHSKPTGSRLKEVQPGDFGLHSGDSVDFHFRVKLLPNPAVNMSLPNPAVNMSKEQTLELYFDPNHEEFRKRLEEYREELAILRHQLLTDRFRDGEDFMEAWYFVEDCRQVGFDPKTSDLYEWLYDRVYVTVMEKEPKIDQDTVTWLETMECNRKSFKAYE